jgi:hypothetical protein
MKMNCKYFLHNHMIENPSSLQQARIFAFLGTTGGKLTYLVFDSSFLSGAVVGGGVVSPGLIVPPGGDGVGSGDGAAGGVGGAGSLSLQPANVRAKAKTATADSDTIFFIVSSPPFLRKF